MVFLSHANPEDNEFTRWLALQLAREGYPVWCDLTKLLGGEDFWQDIERAIRERTRKFLFVLSSTSNYKEGALQELQVAKIVARDRSLSDFIIPLRIDELPYSEINIQLARINAIAFNGSWAKGLNLLLEKLEHDKVEKSASFTPEAVTSWWRAQFGANQGVEEQTEEYLSNWFPISSLPENIYFHRLTRSGIGKIEIPVDLPHPAFLHNQYLVSFAQAEDFAGKLGTFISIVDSVTRSVADSLNARFPIGFTDGKQARDFVTRLLRLAWGKMLRDRRLPTYFLANEVLSFFFTSGLADSDKVHFEGVDGRRTYRQMVGYKTVLGRNGRPSKRFWHFGIDSKPIVYPLPAFFVRPHVVFTDDGRQVWDSKDRLHRARRSQCKDWWNADWRDRIVAAMIWLGKEEGKIELQLGSDLSIEVSTNPLDFTSPVSYGDPQESQQLSDADREDDYADDDEDYEDDEDEE